MVAQLVGEYSATLVHSEDRHHHFALEPRPTRDLDPEFVALHRTITERNARILYRGTDVANYNEPKGRWRNTVDRHPGPGEAPSLPRLVKPYRQPAAGCLTGTLAGGKEIIARAGFPAFMSWISCSRAPRIRSTTPLITSSSAGASEASSQPRLNDKKYLRLKAR